MSERISNMSNILSNMSHHGASLGLTSHTLTSREDVSLFFTSVITVVRYWERFVNGKYRDGNRGGNKLTCMFAEVK